MFNDLYEYLGFDTLNISRELGRKIIYEVLEMLYSSQVTKPKLDSIIKKIKRFKEQVNMVIAAKLLEELNSISDEQLEFIIQNGGKAVIPHIARLYKLARKHSRSDLIGYLEYVWEKHGFPAPVKCPRCGFRAIAPDYSCQICGYVVSEGYIRRELGFDEKFKLYLEEASVAELRSTLELGYVLVGEDGVKNPRLKHKLFFEKKIYYPIYLKTSETALIREELGRRKLEI